MATNIKTPYILFNDLDGQPLENGKIYIGSAGLDPATNAITVYSDASLSTAVSQPISTTAGLPYVSGSPVRLYVAETDFSLRVSNTNNTTVHEDLNAGANQLNLGNIVQDSSGNVLVGKTTATATVAGFIAYSNGSCQATADGTLPLLANRLTDDGDVVGIYKNTAQQGNIGVASGNINMGQGAGTCFTIDSSQNFLVGKTTTSSAVEGIVLEGAGSGTFTRSSQVPLRTNRLGSDGAVMDIRNDDVTVGTISVSGSTTSYNTSSDYRLKEDIQPVDSATARLLQLKPCNFAWKADGTRVDGFIAHELAEVIPEAVTGEKDAMKTVVIQEAVEAQPAVLWTEEDELPEGVVVGDVKTEAVEAVPEVTEEQPDYQGIDQSKIVPLLTSALQEALGKIDSLEARLSALENAE